MDSFHDVDFPLASGLDASAAPTFFTQVVTTASGHEQRNSQWASARLRFDAGVGVRGDADLALLLGFFRARRGQAVAFRFRDPTDNSSAGMTGVAGPVDQALGTGDGVRTRFGLVKRYGASGPERRITRPVAASVRVAIGGVEAMGGWTLGPLGTVSFASAPAAGAAVSAGYIFDVPVRFATDALEVSLAGFRAGGVPSVLLLEVREG